MKISSFILLIQWSVVLAERCKYGPDWHIQQALYLRNQLILVTSEKTIYHIEDFEFKDKKIGFKSVKETNLFSGWLEHLRYIFRYEDYVITLNWEAVSQINRLVGHKVYINKEVTKVEHRQQFKVNMYTYTPGEDPLNFMSLLAKFPEDNIEKNIISIVSFPFDEPSLQKRLFVYYLERSLGMAGTKDKFKRHIMIESKSKFGSVEEVNWVHDNMSEKCIAQDAISNTTVCLSDKYIASKNGFKFYVMEFFGTQYSIKSVEIEKTKDGSRVLKDMTEHETGSMTKLMDCEVRPTGLPPDIEVPDVTKGPKSKSKFNWILIVLIFLVIFFIVAIVVVLFFIVKVVKNIRENRGRKSVTTLVSSENMSTV